MIWQTKTRTFDLTRRALMMGIVNLTPNSFSDGGQFVEVEAACWQADRLASEGATIIDVGGESTRPGAEPVDEEEELRRVMPVIERLAGDRRFVISIDTMKPGVALAAIAAGAEIVNDVSGLRSEAMVEVVRSTGVGVIVMHMKGTPMDMQISPFYVDVVEEVREFFRQRFEACVECGIDPLCMAFDPGIGFGKNLAHNLALVRSLGGLEIEGRPIVLGVSRKSFIGGAIGSDRGEDRAWPTVALTSYGRTRGVKVFRVHEVRANFEALRMTEAILGEEGGG